MTIKLILSVSIVVLVVGSIAGIILNSDEHSDENNLRLAYFPNIGHAIPIIGIEKGFFAEQIRTDTKIETRFFDSGPQVIESLFANSVDL